MNLNEALPPGRKQALAFPVGFSAAGKADARYIRQRRSNGATRIVKEVMRADASSST